MGAKRARVAELARSSRDSDGLSAVVNAMMSDPTFPQQDVLGATAGPDSRRTDGRGASDGLALSLILSQQQN